MTTFGEETETDLFGEQVILCGGLSGLIKASFETLVKNGYQPENAYIECLYELRLVVDLVVKGGLNFMRQAISNTAEYGDYTAGKRIISPAVKEEMQKVLDEIRDGTFARNWIEENQKGCPNFNAMREEERKHPVEDVGKKLRDTILSNNDLDKFYSVSVLFCSLENEQEIPDEDTLWEEVVYWIKAYDPEEAAEKAEEIAKKDEHSYLGIEGDMIHWKFSSVLHVSPMEYEKAVDGKEIFSRFLATPQAEILTQNLFKD